MPIKKHFSHFRNANFNTKCQEILCKGPPPPYFIYEQFFFLRKIRNKKEVRVSQSGLWRGWELYNHVPGVHKLFNKRYLQNAAEVLNFLSVFFNNLSLWKDISIWIQRIIWKNKLNRSCLTLKSFATQNNCNWFIKFESIIL